MVVYGVALLSVCMLVGVFVGVLVGVAVSARVGVAAIFVCVGETIANAVLSTVNVGVDTAVFCPSKIAPIIKRKIIKIKNELT